MPRTRMRTPGRPRSWTYSPLRPGTECRTKRAVSAASMLTSLSSTTPASSRAMLGQAPREAEMADRLLAQPLLESLQQAVQKQLLVERIRRGRRDATGGGLWRLCQGGDGAVARVDCGRCMVPIP